MKPHAFLLLLAAVLSCRAQNSTAANAASPAAPTAVAAQPAPSGVTAVPTKPSDAAVVKVEPAAAAGSKGAALPKPEMQPTMGAVVVSGAADLKPTSPDLGKSLADMRAEQKASMTQQLVDDAQNRKAAFAGVLTIQQPALSPPKLTNLATPTVALAAPPIDAKNRTADLFNTK